MKNIYSIALIVVMTVALGACVTTEILKSKKTEKAPVGEDISFVAIKNLPEHTQLALVTLIEEMYGREKSQKKVSFGKDAQIDVVDNFMSLKGWKVQAISFSDERVVPVSEKSAEIFLEGTLTFINEISQTRTENFLVNYLVKSNGKVVILSATATPNFTIYPEIVGFFVDHQALADAAPTLNTFKDFYTFGLNNSINMFATPQECDNWAEYQKLSVFQKMKQRNMPRPVKGKYAFLCFNMDRMAPAAEFKLVVTNTPSGGSISLIEPSYLVYDEGYRVGVVQFEGALFDLKYPVYFHAFMIPDEPTDAKRIHLARFSNQKVYDDFETIDVPPGSEEIAEKMRQVQSLRLLNPRDRADAKIIQQALKDKGFYKSNVDGLFGKGSKKALRAFRKAEMGKDNIQWDLETQNTLGINL